MSDPTKLHEDQAVRVWSALYDYVNAKTVVASCNQHSASAVDSVGSRSCCTWKRVR